MRVRVHVCKLACSCACVHVRAQAVCMQGGRVGREGEDHLKVEAMKVEAFEAVEVEVKTF